MFERISRSIELVKTSWRILMEDKKLLAFPILSGIVMLLVIATFLLPLIVSQGALSSSTSSATGIVLLFLFYLVSYFVVIFFNVALISVVYATLEGRPMTIGQGLRAAGSHLGSILAWTVVAATVGLVLRLIEGRAGPVGQIAAGLVGGAWTLVTMFVLPGLALENRGVVDAVKGSLSLVKKTWGEGVVGSLYIGLVFTVIGAVGFILLLAALLLQHNVLVTTVAVVLFIVLVAVLAILASAMQGIFVVALYIYATTGRVPAAFDRGLVEGAFGPRTRRFGGTI